MTAEQQQKGRRKPLREELAELPVEKLAELNGVDVFQLPDGTLRLTEGTGWQPPNLRPTPADDGDGPARPEWLWDPDNPDGAYDLSELGEVRAYIEHLEAELAVLEANYDLMTEDMAAVERQRDELKADLEAAELIIDRMKDQRDGLRKHGGRLEQIAAEYLDRIDELEQQRKSVELREAQIAILEANFEMMTEDMAAVERQRDELQAMADKSIATTEDLLRQRDELERRLKLANERIIELNRMITEGRKPLDPIEAMNEHWSEHVDDEEPRDPDERPGHPDHQGARVIRGDE